MEFYKKFKKSPLEKAKFNSMKMSMNKDYFETEGINKEWEQKVEELEKRLK